MFWWLNIDRRALCELELTVQLAWTARPGWEASFSLSSTGGFPHLTENTPWTLWELWAVGPWKPSWGFLALKHRLCCWCLVCLGSPSGPWRLQRLVGEDPVWSALSKVWVGLKGLSCRVVSGFQTERGRGLLSISGWGRGALSSRHRDWLIMGFFRQEHGPLGLLFRTVTSQRSEFYFHMTPWTSSWDMMGFFCAYRLHYRVLHVCAGKWLTQRNNLEGFGKLLMLQNLIFQEK